MNTKNHRIDYHTLRRLVQTKQEIEQAIEDYETQAFPLSRIERRVQKVAMTLKDVRKTLVLQPEYA